MRRDSLPTLPGDTPRRRRSERPRPSEPGCCGRTRGFGGGPAIAGAVDSSLRPETIRPWPGKRRARPGRLDTPGRSAWRDGVRAAGDPRTPRSDLRLVPRGVIGMDPSRPPGLRSVASEQTRLVAHRSPPSTPSRLGTPLVSSAGRANQPPEFQSDQRGHDLRKGKGREGRKAVRGPGDGQGFPNRALVGSSGGQSSIRRIPNGFARRLGTRPGASEAKIAQQVLRSAYQCGAIPDEGVRDVRELAGYGPRNGEHLPANVEGVLR